MTVAPLFVRTWKWGAALLAGWLLMVAGGACAQTPLPAGVRHFDLTDGLPHRQINCLLQDQTGLLWVGTERGLARFDGERFEVVGSDSAAAGTGLLAGPINALAEEPGRAIWAGTPTGLRRLDLRTGRETRIRADPAGRAPINERIFALLYTRAGQLYAGSSAGWLLRRRDSVTFERVVALPAFGAAPPWVCGLDEDAAGRIWLGTQHHHAAFRYDPRTRRLTRFEAPSGVTQSATLALTPDRRTVTVNMAIDGLFQLDSATDTLRPLLDGQPGTRRQRETLVDARHRIWYGWLTGSLNRFDPATGRVADLGRGLPFVGNLQSTYLDRAGTVWIGTQNGLFQFREPGQAFQRLLMQPPDSAVGRRYSTRGLLELPDGQLLVASYRGLLRVDPQRGQVVRTYPGTTVDGQPLDMIGFALLPEPDSAGRGVWVLSEGQGLHWLDLRTGRYQPAERKPTGQARFGRAIVPDGLGHLWLATYEGVFVFDRRTRTMQPFTDPAHPTATYLHGFAVAAHDGQIWLGAEEGLFQLDPVARRVIRRFETVSGGVRALWFDEAPDSVPPFHPTTTPPSHPTTPPPSSAWVGTTTGLYRLDPRTGRTRRFGQAQGLADPVVDALLPGLGSQLWISTDNGLSVLDRRTNRCTSFFQADGLTDNEFNVGSALHTRAGALYFGTVNGLTRCAPQPLAAPTPSTVQLTSLTWFDGATGQSRGRRFDLWPTHGTLPALTLQPGDLFFGASFVLTDGDAPAHHRYAYRLAGFDRGWNAADASHALRYTSLPAGTYTLQLRAAGRDGRWLPARAALRVQVLSPIYQRWWFVLLSALAVAGLIWAAVQARLRQVKALAQVRVRLAADLHDEVGAWLTRVSMHAELARTASYAPERQQQQLARITEASRQAIATMSDVVWAVDARNDNLGELVGRMQELAQALLTPANRTYTFQQHGLDPDKLLPPAVRQNLFLIYKEALHNVVKHSAAPHVRLFIGYRPDGAFHLEIADDGPAQTPPTPGSGQGLRNMQLRAAALKGAMLTVEKGAMGYRVWLRLPALG